MSGGAGDLRVVVLGFLINEPTGGQVWHYLNYVRGLADLGYDVYYIEDSDDWPMCFDAQLTGATTDPRYGLHFASRAFRRLGLGERWAYYDAHVNEWKGARARDACEICETADLVLNISGANPLRSWLEKVPARVFVDTDPGFTQIRNLTRPGDRQRCEAHTAFFSFGENIGKPGCAVPSDGFPWRPTRQPVSLTAWPLTAGPDDGLYTTVMQWESHPILEHQGLKLAMKSESFRQFAGLPQRVGRVFELAIRGDSANLAALRASGWGLADIDAVSADPWTFQSFIQGSKAEFSIAKQGYVVTRCGWFSERSANYLASGRPVIAQDTGFTEWLSTGNGVFAVSSLQDVADAMAELDSDYEGQCRSAHGVAREYFGADRVLPSLVDRAMSSPGGCPTIVPG